MAPKDKRKGIPIQQPLFYWEYALGPEKNQKKGTTLVDRCEILISGNKAFYYGYIVEGELYAFNAVDWCDIFWKPWLSRNKGKKPAQLEKVKPGLSFIHAPIYHKRVSDIKELGKPKEPQTIFLVPGETYRAWVDYYLVDEQGLRTIASDRREHFVGDMRWAPTPPYEDDKASKPKEWQVFKFTAAPKGQRPKIILKCRRYAFLPRIMDLTWRLKKIQEEFVKELSRLGCARSFMQCLYQIGSFSIQDNYKLQIGVVNHSSGKPVDPWIKHYAKMTGDLNDMLKTTEMYLMENAECARIARKANAVARVIYHTLKENKQFLKDFNLRDASGHNSDQVRDIIAQAQLTLFKTPMPVFSRDLAESEIVFNDDRSAVLGVKSFGGAKPYPNTCWIFKKKGQTPKVKGYWLGKGWDSRFWEEVYKPFISGAKANGLKNSIDKTQKTGALEEAALNLNPLYAARENLTFITLALGAHVGNNMEKFSKDVFEILQSEKLLDSSVTFNQAKAMIKTQGSVDALATPKGMSGILLGSGLYLLFEGVFMADAWNKAGGSKKTKDYLDAVTKTIDFAEDVVGITAETLNYLNKAETAAKVLGKTAGVLGALADGMDTGLFIYYEMVVEDKQKQIDFDKEYLDRTTAYNFAIAGGRAVNTLGSALTCTIVGAPIGLVLKAVGTGVSTLVELAKAIDEIGEKEKKLFHDVWKKLKANKAHKDILDFYDRLSTSYDGPPHTALDEYLAGLEEGLGDSWVGMKNGRVDAIRQVFNVSTPEQLQKKIAKK